MFENVGEKIKTFARVIFSLELIASIISGIVIFLNDDDLTFIALLTVILGIIFSWFSALLIYGFGELIEKTCEIAKNTQKEKVGTPLNNVNQNKPIKETSPTSNTAKSFIFSSDEEHNNTSSSKTVVPKSSNGFYSCPKCGCALKTGQTKCSCSCEIDWSSYNIRPI